MQAVFWLNLQYYYMCFLKKYDLVIITHYYRRQILPPTAGNFSISHFRVFLSYFVQFKIDSNGAMGIVSKQGRYADPGRKGNIRDDGIGTVA